MLMLAMDRTRWRISTLRNTHIALHVKEHLVRIGGVRTLPEESEAYRSNVESKVREEVVVIVIRHLVII